MWSYVCVYLKKLFQMLQINEQLNNNIQGLKNAVSGYLRHKSNTSTGAINQINLIDLPLS